jgi:hypothetical protein
MATNPLSFDEVRTAGFPGYFLNMEEKWHEMRLLLAYDRSRLIESGIVGQSMHGLALAWNYFPHAWGVRCNDRLSPLETFADDERLQNALTRRKKYGSLKSESDLRKALRTVSGAQSVSNYRPTAAAAIYDRYLPKEGGVTWDMSSGYGGRLLGAMACDRVLKYIGTDPATLTMDGLCEMRGRIAADGRAVGGDTEFPKSNCTRLGSEDFVPDKSSVRLAWTSPPYYNARSRYSNEPTQSFIKFPSREAWLNGFLAATLSNCYHCLTTDGKLVINIANVSSYKTLVDDFLGLAARCGFRHEETLHLALSAGWGARRNNNPIKTEPIFVFSKKP